MQKVHGWAIGILRPRDVCGIDQKTVRLAIIISILAMIASPGRSVDEGLICADSIKQWTTTI